MRPRARLHVNDNVLLVRVGVRHRFRGNLRLVQALLPKGFAQPLERFVDNLFSVGLPQPNLHCGCSGSLAGWRLQSFQAHLVEEQILPRHEIQPHAIGRGRHHGPQVRVISGSIKRTQAFGDFFSIDRLPGFHGYARG